MPGNPSTWLAKPKWRSRWYQASFAGLLILCALSDTALALTALLAFKNGNWGGIAMLVIAALFISVAYPMIALRTGDILYPPGGRAPRIGELRFTSRGCSAGRSAAMTTGPAPRAAEQQPERKATKPACVRHFFASRCWGYWPYVAIMAAVGMVCSIPFALAAGLALATLFLVTDFPELLNQESQT